MQSSAMRAIPAHSALAQVPSSAHFTPSYTSFNPPHMTQLWSPSRKACAEALLVGDDLASQEPLLKLPGGRGEHLHLRPQNRVA